MPTFQLLYFRDSILEQSEEIEVGDVLEAVQTAAGRSAHLRVEIWFDHRRVAQIGALLIEPRPRRRRKSFTSN
jgi:hypothetical protein